MASVKIGFIGLGLIGGSIAKAIRQYYPDYEILAFDKNRETLALAVQEGTIHTSCSSIDENFRGCRYIFLCAPVAYNTAYLPQLKNLVDSSCILTDAGSVKTSIHEEVISLGLEENFIGGHPMAGKHYSGYKYSDGSLFEGTSMIIVPPEENNIRLLDRVKQLLAPAQFAHITVTTAQKHDSMIAFTSQLAHVVSNAYVKSPTATAHKGFSAGSYRDLTRVAWLAEDMWTELFLENKEPLLFELRHLIHSLQEYEQAIEEDDAKRLRALLADGKQRKEQIDGNVK